jgi:O-antigen ligase
VRFSIGPLPTTLLEVMILILGSVWIFKKTIAREWRTFFHFWWSVLPRRVLIMGIAFLLVSATLSVFISPDTRAALGVLRAYFIEPALFFFIVSDIAKDRQIFLHVMYASILSALGIALVAVAQKILGMGRVSSVFPYPNAVGLYTAPIAPYLFGIIAFAVSSRYYRAVKITILAIGAILIAAMAAAIVYAQTEAALVALAVSALIFLFSWNRASRIAALIILAAFSLTVFVSEPLKNYVTRKATFKDWSGKVRKGMWKETGAMLADHWLTGAGLSGYKTVFEPYHTRTHIEIFQYPHSFVLNFWSEIGLYGLFAILFVIGIFFFLILSTLRRSRKLPRADGTLYYKAACLALLCSMTTILIHGLVDVPYFKNDLSVFFWALIALSFLLYQQVSEKIPTP